MRSNQDYKNEALNSLSGNWAHSVLATIVVLLIVLLCEAPMQIMLQLQIGAVPMLPLMGGTYLAMFLIAYPLVVGYANAFRVLYSAGDNAVTRNSFKLGFTRYLHIFWTFTLMVIKVLLWSLLLFIPGIVKAYAYSQAIYIMVENPEMRAIDAIHKSQEMMKGHKFDLFYLQLSFIGWVLLCILTLSLGFLWFMPYVYTAQAAFYEDLKRENASLTA